MANTAPVSNKEKKKPIVLRVMNLIVLILSVILIVWISTDTFNRVDFLENHKYMTFQFWVCMVFIADFFIELYFADSRWRFIRNRFIFLLLSIPFLNIVNLTGLQLSREALYFVRFIPLARGGLAISIVIRYLTSNAISSLFLTYLTIMTLVGYFCSLIFYQSEAGVNPEVNSYWSALWWSAMNMSTVGCNINPVTGAGKIVAVVLPVCGTIIFPLFTVYLTNFVTRSVKNARTGSDDNGV